MLLCFVLNYSKEESERTMPLAEKDSERTMSLAAGCRLLAAG
jgi:hypothetical protein